MTIEEFQQAKRVMEEEIRHAALVATCRFHKATGHSPSSINIDCINTTAYGDMHPVYTVAKVTSTVSTPSARRWQAWA